MAAKTLPAEPQGDSLRGKRDRAILALLIGCGLPRAELVGLGLEIFKSVRSTGSSLTSLARGSTFARCQFRRGQRVGG